MKETYTSVLGRIDEKLKQNKIDHDEIKLSIKDLSTHVNEELGNINEENKKRDERLTSLEKTRTSELAVYKCCTAILAIAVSAVTILSLIGVI